MICALLAGTTSWVVPAGVTKITVHAVGPGANGFKATSNSAGAAGGGGAAIGVRFDVTPGETFNVSVPAGHGLAPTSFAAAAGATRQLTADYGLQFTGSGVGPGGLAANNSMTGGVTLYSFSGGNGAQGGALKGGGGGCAGPNGAGGAGGTGGLGGGGGANGGGPSLSATGGGLNRFGVGGGAGGVAGGADGQPGVNGGGGGNGNSASGGVSGMNGGDGSYEALWTDTSGGTNNGITIGPGSGAGGCDNLAGAVPGDTYYGGGGGGGYSGTLGGLGGPGFIVVECTGDTPWISATTPFYSSVTLNTAFNVDFTGLHSSGDLLVIIDSAEGGALGTPAGWTSVPGGPWAAGTSGATNSVSITAHYLWSTGTETTVSLAGITNNIRTAYGLVIKEANTSTPIAAAAGSATLTASSTLSLPSITLSSGNSLIVGGMHTNRIAATSPIYGIFQYATSSDTEEVRVLRDANTSDHFDSGLTVIQGYKKLQSTAGSITGSTSTGASLTQAAVTFAVNPVTLTPILGDATYSFTRLTNAATGQLLVKASSGSTTARVTKGTATGALKIIGTASKTFARITGTETGKLIIGGSGTSTTSRVTSTASGKLTIKANATKTLNRVIGSAAASSGTVIHASGASTTARLGRIGRAQAYWAVNTPASRSTTFETSLSRLMEMVAKLSRLISLDQLSKLISNLEASLSRTKTL